MALGPVEVFGGRALHEADPPVERWRDAIYTPWSADGRWGLYDPAGAVIEASVDRAGMEGRPLGQSLASFTPDAALDTIEEPLVYGGRLIHHYGHFLVETLPRFWPLAAPSRRPKRRVLLHCLGAPNFFDTLPYAAAIFGALGLGPDHVVIPDRPVRVRELEVPHPAFRQEAYAHRAFRRLGLVIGDRLLARGAVDRMLRRGPRWGERRGAPAYLSKRWLVSGVQRATNEAELESALAARGIDAVHPELMSLADQVRLFETRRTVIGMAGSGFHTSLFARRPARLVVLAPHARLTSNFALIDALTGAQTLYRHVQDLRPQGSVDDGDAPRFAETYALPDPEALAEEIAARL